MHRNSKRDEEREERVLASAEMFKEGMLPLSEAEEQVNRAVDYLEEEINRIDGTPGKWDRERHEYLSSLFMSILAEEKGVAPPTNDK